MTSGEAWDIEDEARAIMERSNREQGSDFPLEKSVAGLHHYPLEVVRAAVNDVLLKTARGYSWNRKKSPGARLWANINWVGRKLEEGAVGPTDEVIARCRELEARRAPARPAEPTQAAPPALLVPPAAPLADLAQQLEAARQANGGRSRSPRIGAAL